MSELDRVVCPGCDARGGFCSVCNYTGGVSLRLEACGTCGDAVRVVSGVRERCDHCGDAGGDPLEAPMVALGGAVAAAVEADGARQLAALRADPPMRLYGSLCDHKTGVALRAATRSEWLRSRGSCDGVFLDDTGRRVYCDGPEDDPTLLPRGAKGTVGR